MVMFMSIERHEQDKDVKKLPIMAAMLLGGFISLLSETLLNVALPKFMEDFGISANTAGWLVTGYLLVIGICVPIAAFLMLKFRARLLFFASMLFFIAGTLVCLMAQNFTLLLSGRLVQAVGTAILMPLMLNVVLLLNPPEKRGAANGIVILVIMLAPAVGPTISGFILMHFSWRALFFFTLPLSLAALLIGVIFMRDITRTTGPRIDLLSMLLSTAGFGLFIYGLSYIGHLNVTGELCLAAGAVFLAVFIVRQLRLKSPMLDLRVFKIPRFAIGIIYTSMAMISLFSNLMMMPIFLQKVLMLTTFATGLVMMPGGFMNGLMAPVTGKIYDRFGSKYLLPAGFMIILFAIYRLSFLDETASKPFIIGLLCLLNFGVPFVMTSAQTDALNSLPVQSYPHGTAILNTVQQISAALGSSFFVTIMTIGQTGYLEHSGKTGPGAAAEALNYGINLSYKVGFLLLGAAFAVSAVQLVFRIKKDGFKIKPYVKKS